MKRRQAIPAMLAAGVTPVALSTSASAQASRAAMGPGSEVPPGVDKADQPLLGTGLLDVTKAPYFADPTGKKDSTAAIQSAVIHSRDYQYACWFPSGTYLISDTINCEQQVAKLDKPRFTDGQRQTYWDIPNRNFVLIGSSAGGKRPVLKLAPNAKGFDDPAKPKNLVHIWAQSRHDIPGKDEPEWGKEQPNISFGHTFRNIDIDVRGRAGAVGIRHTGSQGTTLQDCTIHAEGAFAGMSNCPGQGGGTYNIEVIGGQYGLLSAPECRFPILTGCSFKGQTTAPVSHASQNPPMVLVGCLIESHAPVAIDLTKNQSITGVTLVDCIIRFPKRLGTVFSAGPRENLFLEDCYVQGATAISPSEGATKIPKPAQWTRVERYSLATGKSTTTINGKLVSEPEIVRWNSVPSAPDYAAIHARHWSRLPLFEDKDAVNIKSLGAKGDGEADDTAAFRAAIAKHQKIFVPRGVYKLTEPLALKANTALFGLHRAFSILRNTAGMEAANAPAVITMPDDAQASPSLSFLSIGGLIEWTAGRGVLVMAPARFRISGNGGGRLCGVTGIRSGFVVEGTRQRLAFYSLNVERVYTNPQSVIRNASNVRIYYLKVEATPTGYGQGIAVNTGNTPLGVFDSRDIRIYCVNGNVTTSQKRAMVEIADSDNVLVTHAKSFKTGDFPQVRETRGKSVIIEIPSDRASALLVRE